MSYLNLGELHERNEDIFTNLTTLTPEGKLGLPPISGESHFPWMELWTHILEEFGLRGMGLPGGFQRNLELPIPTKSGPAKGTLELQRRGLNAKGKLVKFGKEIHLRESYETGHWLISPASSYQNDPCRARQDSELEFAYRVPWFRKNPLATRELDEKFSDHLVDVQKFRVSSPGDYYTACFARTFIHRLFDDFRADSCLIVLDEDVFTRRMLNAFAEFRPRWEGICRRVDYIDPILPRSHPDVFFAKHFRYAYQDEFRFVWAPIPPKENLQPIFVELGPLKDCCELLTSSQINS